MKNESLFSLLFFVFFHLQLLCSIFFSYKPSKSLFVIHCLRGTHFLKCCKLLFGPQSFNSNSTRFRLPLERQVKRAVWILNLKFPHLLPRPSYPLEWTLSYSPRPTLKKYASPHTPTPPFPGCGKGVFLC